MSPNSGHKCLSASTFTVPTPLGREDLFALRHKCLSASTFTVPRKVGQGEQTFQVTNAYRQVHLLYSPYRTSYTLGNFVTNAYRQVHLLYSARRYRWGLESRHKCLSASTFTVRKEEFDLNIAHIEVTNAYRQVHLLYVNK